jgi:hypothetical protein
MNIPVKNFIQMAVQWRIYGKRHLLPLLKTMMMIEEEEEDDDDD